MLNELLPNLTDDVASNKIVSGATIYRDQWSIPHIYADNPYDAFFAQGYATAQDRLWQMDFDRLRCLGRSAEYIGSPALTEDALLRRRSFERVSCADYGAVQWRRQDRLRRLCRWRECLYRFRGSAALRVRTVGYAARKMGTMALHFGLQSPEQCGGFVPIETLAREVSRENRPEQAAKLSPGYQQGMYLTVPPGVVYEGPAENAVEELRSAVNATAPLREIDGGSNGWAVSGELTESGVPMVGGDSHRGLEVPNVYYQVHIRSEEFDVLGHSIPGMPLVLHFAHNRYRRVGNDTRWRRHSRSVC